METLKIIFFLFVGAAVFFSIYGGIKTGTIRIPATHTVRPIMIEKEKNFGSFYFAIALMFLLGVSMMSVGIYPLLPHPVQERILDFIL